MQDRGSLWSHQNSLIKTQFDLEPDKITVHHDLGPSIVKKDHGVIDKIKEAILKHENPFAAEGD